MRHICLAQFFFLHAYDAEERRSCATPCECSRVCRKVSAILPGANEGGRRGEGVDGSSAVELSDIGAVLQTATAALEEIRSQVSSFQECQCNCRELLLAFTLIFSGLSCRCRQLEVASAPGHPLRHRLRVGCKEICAVSQNLQPQSFSR